MVRHDPSTAKPPEVWALGPLPPPVTGMALLTARVVKRLEQSVPVRVLNLAWHDSRPNAQTRAIRMLRAVIGIFRLAFHGRVQNARLYLAANSQGGLLTTGLTIIVGQRLGYTIYLHHHTYNYIDEHNAKMAWIDRNMRAGDVHIMHCPMMIDEFRSRYTSKAGFEFLFPSIVSLPLARPRQHPSPPFRIGMLANLMLAKGVDLVIDTFRALSERRRNVRLVLAGPFATREAEQLVNQAIEQFGERVTCLGAVFNERKLEFYNSIDCFLFPSRNESWGIVLNEALAAGLPVIATDRGCIRTLVGDRAGVVVKDAGNYVSEAVRQIESWIDSPERYQAASEAAIEQADYLHRGAIQQLERLNSRICSPTEDTSPSIT
jgi:glycosyltransferase involved in cell wall biosynthesis